MNNKNHIRTAAIVYGEDSTALNVSTIHKKIVESVLINNSNKYISVSNLIDLIQQNYGLDFDEQEILEIIKSEEKHFLFEEKEDTNLVCLSFERFELLKERLNQQSIESHVEIFIGEVYSGKLANKDLSESLYKFLYELLNKNISAFSKIISPDNNAEEITVDADRFTSEERLAINEFLNWDDLKKNKALFSLISYCIEYSLMSNNIDKASMLLKSISNKVFYLDNNIIYRAIGLNGKERQTRILNFLSKCTDSGQKLIISKFTYSEFRSTIKYHIKNLRNIGFSKINPNIFSKYSIRPGFYNYYHQWRGNKKIYGFDLFEAHLKSLYDQFKRDFKIDEDYKIPFDEENTEISTILLNYESELSTYKENNHSEINRYDALNIYLIEQKRKLANRNIKDTKYFFVSTDQKLRNWDFSRNKNQPIALLPSQWMAILLKYYSRTDNDYESFVSFLRLPGSKPILDETDVNIVLSGISEITEDFERQESLFENFVQEKFYKELEGLDSSSKKGIATVFAMKMLDAELDKVKGELHEKNISKALTDKNHQIKITEAELQHSYAIKGETENAISDLQKIKPSLDQIGKERFNRFIYAIVVVIVAYFGLWSYGIYHLSWENLEPAFLISQPAAILLLYLYIYWVGFAHPFKYLESIKSTSLNYIYEEFNFNPERLSILEQQLIDVNDQIENLEINLKGLKNS